MILYHGSNVKISKPDLTYPKPFKDFGQGFYLSADEQQARNLAITKTEQMKTGEPTINKFSFDESIMSSEELRINPHLRGIPLAMWVNCKSVVIPL